MEISGTIPTLVAQTSNEHEKMEFNVVRKDLLHCVLAEFYNEKKRVSNKFSLKIILTLVKLLEEANACFVFGNYCSIVRESKLIIVQVKSRC